MTLAALAVSTNAVERASSTYTNLEVVVLLLLKSFALYNEYEALLLVQAGEQLVRPAGSGSWERCGRTRRAN